MTPDLDLDETNLRMRSKCRFAVDWDAGWPSPVVLLEDVVSGATHVLTLETAALLSEALSLALLCAVEEAASSLGESHA